MPKNTKKNRTINAKLTKIDKNTIRENVKLPYNGSAVTEKSFSFSFACFDRTHKLFNLGSDYSGNAVSGEWFIDLIDCLKDASNSTISELRHSMHDLHPIDWAKTNTNPPDEECQREYWQFRINKSKGRVIGFLIENVFYVVWLDPHHNLTNSEGYGKEVYYKPANSIYEVQEQTIKQLNLEIESLKKDLSFYDEYYKNDRSE